MINTPMWLDQLDSEHAVFVGSAEETRTVPTMIGPQEIEASYPRFVVQREVWEESGRPVMIHLKASATGHIGPSGATGRTGPSSSSGDPRDG